MDNSAELNQLYAEQNSLELSKAALESKIARLRTAKSQVDSIESDVRQLKKTVQDEKSIGDDVWTGTQRDLHIQFLSSMLDADYQSYIQNIGSFRDSIADEIRRLDSELLNTVGLLEWIWSKITSLFS